MFVKMSCIVVLLACAAVFVAGETEPSDGELMQMINTIDVDQSLPLFGGLSVERLAEGRALPAAGAKESLLDRAVRYMKSHELKFSFDTNDEAQHVDGARSSKLKKIAIPLLLALKFKMAIILPLLLSAIAIVSLKGLKAGLLALLFSGATLIKELWAKKQDRVTTAYITGSQPMSAEIVHSDWNRNGQISPQDLAYNYHTLPQAAY